MTAANSERLPLPSTNHTRYQSIGPTEPEDEVIYTLDYTNNAL
jgi:hypothetical protein